MLRLVMLLLAVLLAGFVFTQIIWPAIIGTPFFPLFRSSTRKAKRELEEARYSRVDAELQHAAAEEKLRVAQLETKGNEEIQGAYDDLVSDAEEK